MADRDVGMNLSGFEKAFKRERLYISPSGLYRFQKEAHGNPLNWDYILMNEVDLFVKTKNQAKNQVLRGAKSVEMEK